MRNKKGCVREPLFTAEKRREREVQAVADDLTPTERASPTVVLGERPFVLSRLCQLSLKLVRKVENGLCGHGRLLEGQYRGGEVEIVIGRSRSCRATPVERREVPDILSWLHSFS